MTKNELNEMLEGIIEPSIFESFHETFELQKQLEDAEKQLKEARQLTTASYHKRVQELNLRKESIKKQAQEYEKELESICIETCKRNIHMIENRSARVYCIGTQSSSMYNAEYCPLCDEFFNTTKTTKYGQGRNTQVITKEEFKEWYYQRSSRFFIITHEPEIGMKYNRSIEKSKILSYFENLVDTTKDEGVVILAKRFLELSHRIVEIVKEKENIEVLLKKMCATFGHYASMPHYYDSEPDNYCMCCSGKFTFDDLISSYKSAPMHGTIDFEYAKFGYKRPKEIEYRVPYKRDSFWDD